MQTITSSPPARRGTGQTGQYLYAVIDGARVHDFGPIGLDGGRVYTVGDGRLAAVVSDVPNTKVRPERRRLAAHHDVLKRLRQDHTVLPMSFGLIAGGVEAVRRILTEHRETFEQQIRRVAGKVEMGLRVVWDVPNIFEFFLETHSELRDLRDHLFRGGREPVQGELIELGRTFDRLLNEHRAAHTESVSAVLGPRCAEIKENTTRGEREVMSLACLVGQNDQKAFEDGVCEAARRFDNHYAFDFNGPWPPHNFVEVRLAL